jgi:hypothetical protein
MRRTLLALSLFPLGLAPGLAAAQGLQSGPNSPAASSQPPPGIESPRPGDTSGASGGRGEVNPDNPASTAPPPGHRVLGGPPMPGATQPQSSEGMATSRDRIPPNPGNRPDAPTTGTGR